MQENSWDKIESDLQKLKSKVGKYKSVIVGSRPLMIEAKEIAQAYFREVRPGLVLMNIGLNKLDEYMSTLLKLSATKNRASTYKVVLSNIIKEKIAIETLREIKIGEKNNKSVKFVSGIIEYEKKIITTLNELLPDAANSYRQSLMDLTDDDRLSYQGTASELREVLRSVLDYLAPDEEVMKQESFKLEVGLKKPSMIQKAMFIFSSRGVSKSSIKTPEDAVRVVEAFSAPASFIRSTYTRASVSTHVATQKKEVYQLKMYVDTVLCELLEIHKT